MKRIAHAATAAAKATLSPAFCGGLIEAVPSFNNRRNRR